MEKSKTFDLDVLFEEIGMVWSKEPGNPHSIQSISVTLAGAYPVQWQCNIKYSSKATPWSTAVEDTPAEALAQALHLSLQGPETRRTEGVRVFYEDRESAQAEATRLEVDNIELDVEAVVQFEPYKGFVIVVFYNPDTTTEEAVEDGFGSGVEIRPGTPIARLRGSPSSSDQVSDTYSGPRMESPKKVLEQEWKKLHGKFPPREWKKAFLAQKLDEGEGN